ncbi:MAG: 7-carboxy-7-deazaguanine synthase [Acidobacteriota bacterium]|jgi:7-carboxy-7-deazaguanine synthase (Cx14CxxC type)|nr:7-carboxy-7-deazaguanine synthase [Acidobacteriota bacterium]
MTYSVKELFYTLQGEGANTGRPAVFCRFAGCNLWTGLERDRANAICQFCDTQFVGTDGPGGKRFADALDLARSIDACWSSDARSDFHRFVVFTGGEPLLQLDQVLVDAVHAFGFEIAIETNGTIPPPHNLDWICVSPKAGAALVICAGDELKLVYPQSEASPPTYEDLQFRFFYLQPMYGDRIAENTAAAIDYCKHNPRWRLSIQTHKFLGIP